MKLHHFTFIRVLPVVAIALLASCGGGYGGGGNNRPAPMSTPPAPMATPSATSEQFSATLNGSSEVPPNPSAATATGTLTVDTATLVMTATVTTSGIAGTVAHIHEGAVGVSGPIIFQLTQTQSPSIYAAGSGVWTTTVTITEAQLATLRAGNYYFNVHSNAYPNGEIRGQIMHQ